eukprot:scaffold16219_cov102-Isochrysis_galbana.AAC.3
MPGPAKHPSLRHPRTIRYRYVQPRPPSACREPREIGRGRGSGIRESRSRGSGRGSNIQRLETAAEDEISVEEVKEEEKNY